MVNQVSKKKRGQSVKRLALQLSFLISAIIAQIVMGAVFFTLGHYDSFLYAVILLVISIIVGTFCLSNVFKSYNQRIRQIRATIEEIESGNWEAQIPKMVQDELGLLADAVNRMIRSNRRLVENSQNMANKIGDAAQQLSSSVEEHTASSNEIGSTMSQIAAGASEQAELMGKNKAEADVLDKTIEDITSHVHLIDKSAGELAQSSKENQQAVATLRDHSEKTIATTQAIIQAISKLEERSKNIDQMIEMLTDIAGQTNLLALNAAIEAARAGEQGKGFAVVADEVRKLSTETDQALKQMSELVTSIHGDTEQTVALAGNTSQVMNDQVNVVQGLEKSAVEISGATNVNSEQVGRIVSSIKEMVTRNKKIKQAISDMTEISQQTAAGTEEVTASVEEQAAGMESLSHLAAGLEQDAELVRKNLNQFK